MKESYEKNVTRRQGDGPGPGRSGDKRASFVITLYLEPRSVEAAPEWRWRVSHIQTGEQVYFKRLDDFLEYVSTQSGVPRPS